MTTHSRWKTIIILVLSALASTAQVDAQVALGVTKSSNVSAPVMPGQEFQYIIQYNCTSITEACMNSAITDVLPAGLDWASANVQLIPSVHVASATYNEPSHTVTFTMINPLPAGSTGELRIAVKVASNATDMMVIDNVATFDASNAPAVMDNAEVTVTNPPVVQSLSINKTDPNVVLDQNVEYSIAVCNNANGAVQNSVTIVDTLPADAVFVSASGGGVYDMGTDTVTWAAGTINPGACFTQTIIVQYPSSIYNNGDCVTNSAQFNSTPVGGPAYTRSDSESACFPVPQVVTINKSDPNVVLDQDIPYTIQVCNPTLGTTLSSLTMADPLPVGSIFVSADMGGVYTMGTHTVNWTLPAMAPGDPCFVTNLVIRYPSPTFVPLQCVTNTATASVTPVSGSPYTRNDGESDCFELAQDIGFGKFPNSGNRYVSQSIHFTHGITNDGSDPLTNVVLIDTVPKEVEVTRIDTHSAGMSSGSINVQVHYQTNMNATWTLAGAFTISPSNTINVSGLGLAAGEVISMIRWTYLDPLPSNFSSSSSSSTATGFYSTVLANEWVTGSTSPGPAVLPGTVITNSSTISADNVPDVTDTGLITVVEATSRPDISKTFTGPTQLIPGGMTTVSIVVSNDNSADIPYTSPYVVTDLLPVSMKYVPASESSPAGTVFEEIADYNGTGRTLLRWTLPAGISIAPNSSTTPITAGIMIQQGVPAGPIDNTAGVSNSPALATCDGSSAVDANDVDGDLDTADSICTDSDDVNVLTVAAMESIKWVKGQLDTEYSRFPDVGSTVAGGLADYRLIVKNVGSISMTDVTVIDILPWVGDAGVLDPQARLTEWRPNLVGAVVPSDPTIIVYYSLDSNPCRTELNFNPAGCTPGNWTTTLPPDITSIQSLKFDFADLVIAPGDSLVLEWPMRAPLGTPVSGLVAWNSFGFIASRTDDMSQLLAAEPIKVGIAITEEPDPGIVGDYVWFDANCNGVRDEGEMGLNGFRVDLYMDDGDEIPEPGGDDTFVSFTVTGNDFNGDPGYYLFSGLPVGSYFLVFTPPTGSNYIPSWQTIGPDPSADSDPGNSGVTGIVMVPALFDTRDIDAGFCAPGTPMIDVSSLKTVDNLFPLPGSPVNYTVTVTNSGVDDAPDVVVTDSLPAGITIQSSSATQGTFDEGTGVWTVGNLTALTSQTLTVTALVTGEDAIENCVEATTSATDLLPFNDINCITINDDTFIIDLEVTKVVDVSAGVPGDPFTYTVTVQNTGGIPASGVVVEDALPAGLIYASDSATDGTYDSGTGLWTVGGLAPGQTATLTLVTTAVGVGTLINCAEVAATDQDSDADPMNNDMDSDPANLSGTSPAEDDEACVPVTITDPKIDLSVEKTVSVPTAFPGDMITYLITVSNSGPDDGTGISIFDQLPIGVTHVSNTASQGSYDPGTGIWTIGNMLNGAVETLNITVTVN